MGWEKTCPGAVSIVRRQVVIYPLAKTAVLYTKVLGNKYQTRKCQVMTGNLLGCSNRCTITKGAGELMPKCGNRLAALSGYLRLCTYSCSLQTAGKSMAKLQKCFSGCSP
mmetsp:Transcript_3871/g.6025  ORF Transcript_3871/g.6025 Transcript_3871/m.6025 type:complete len:110 (+) Transcript_3871:159-488(+)